MKMRIMSYNIHHGVGMDGKLDVERIADVIDGSGAEVIGLQEVDRHFGERSDFQDQAKELAALLNMEYSYGPNLVLPALNAGGDERQYGNALLSKFPILHTGNLALTVGDGDDEEPRGVLWSKLDTGSFPLTVYVTHLDLDEQVRKMQFDDLQAMLKRQEGAKILMGDFNHTPEGQEFHQFQTEAGLLGLESSRENLTFPANAPDRKIDYIFVSKEFHIACEQAIPALASDHLPLVVEVSNASKEV